MTLEIGKAIHPDFSMQHEEVICGICGEVIVVIAVLEGIGAEAKQWRSNKICCGIFDKEPIPSLLFDIDGITKFRAFAGKIEFESMSNRIGQKVEPQLHITLCDFPSGIVHAISICLMNPDVFNRFMDKSSEAIVEHGNNWITVYDRINNQYSTRQMMDQAVMESCNV